MRITSAAVTCSARAGRVAGRRARKRTAAAGSRTRSYMTQRSGAGCGWRRGHSWRNERTQRSIDGTRLARSAPDSAARHWLTSTRVRCIDRRENHRGRGRGAGGFGHVRLPPARFRRSSASKCRSPHCCGVGLASLNRTFYIGSQSELDTAPESPLPCSAPARRTPPPLSRGHPHAASLGSVSLLFQRSGTGMLRSAPLTPLTLQSARFSLR